MADMPSSVELEQAFGSAGAHSVTEPLLKQLREQERSGRLVRDAKVEDNCMVAAEMTVEFTGGGTMPASMASDWIDFGRIKYVQRPVFTSGCTRLGGEQLPADFSGFALETQETVPCQPVVIGYRMERGLYTGAKVVVFALDAVTAGFRASVGLLWVGPAVRMG
jgi:hypothetical protein